MTIKAKGKPTVKDYNKLAADFGSLNERVEKAETSAKEYEAKLADMQATGRFPSVQTSNINSDESKALRNFGCSSVKELIQVNTCQPKFNHVSQEIKGMVVQLKNDFETARIIAQIFYDGQWDHLGATEKQDRFAKVNSIKETYYYKNVLEPKLKAFGTGVSGGGAEWIPTAIASSYISEAELERQIVGALKQINMPTSPYELPTNGFSEARRATEGVTATEGGFATGALSFKAKKFQEYYIFPEELNEDSAPDIIALGKLELTEAHQRGFEQALINGTEFGTTHIDSDTQAGSAELAAKQWHGFRKLALDNAANGATVDFANAVVSDAKLRLMRQRMGKLGINPKNLLWIPGSVSYLQMLGTDNVTTVDKMGPAATVLKGMLGSYDGIPIMETGYMREDMSDAGVYDGVTTDRTGMILVHRNRWYFGTRRPIRLAIRPSKSADDRIEMASYSRVDFVGHDQDVRTKELGVTYGLDIAT